MLGLGRGGGGALAGFLAWHNGERERGRASEGEEGKESERKLATTTTL